MWTGVGEFFCASINLSRSFWGGAKVVASCLFLPSCDWHFGSYFATQWVGRWTIWYRLTRWETDELASIFYTILTKEKSSSDYIQDKRIFEDKNAKKSNTLKSYLPEVWFFIKKCTVLQSPLKSLSHAGKFFCNFPEVVFSFYLRAAVCTGTCIHLKRNF